MKQTRKEHSPVFKGKVALAALQGGTGFFVTELRVVSRSQRRAMIDPLVKTRFEEVPAI